MSSLVPMRDSDSSWMTAFGEYFANIGRAISTTFEGLSVTSSWLFRRPITIQYPDRMQEPVQVQLPENYRGVLEVDIGLCTGCLLCARACPIDAIDVKVEKNKETGVREITKFDIDIGLCMYCGLCTEACNFKSIVHTREFEATTGSPDGLVLKFVGEPVPVSKAKPNAVPPRRPVGSILHLIVPSIPQRGQFADLKAPGGPKAPQSKATDVGEAKAEAKKGVESEAPQSAKDNKDEAAAKNDSPSEST